MTSTEGVKAIGELAVSSTQSAPEQLDFGILPRVQQDGKRGEAARELVRQHVRGRPPGSQNLATREAKAFIRKVFGDPLIEGFRWAMHTPASLALELGCTKIEAFDRLESLRRDLTRYMHAPQAPEDADGFAVPVFNVTIGSRSATGEALPPWVQVENAKSLETHNKGNGQAGLSHGGLSHAGAKPLE